MERVFNTVELLELLLAQVDIRTLLTSCTRVSCTWNHVIRDCPQLQTQLFFRPDASLTGHAQSQPAVRTNPLLLRAFGDQPTNSSNTSSQTTSTAHHGALAIEPSWRRMLIQQPAANMLGVWKVETGYSFQNGFKSTTEVLALGGEGGIRMGTLLDTVYELAQGSPWTLYWGEDGWESLEEERYSLLVLKARTSEKASLHKMLETSDVVVKINRWTGAIYKFEDSAQL